MIRNVDEWRLYHIAAALTRAKRLEKLRTDFHKELISCIIYPSIPLDPMIERSDSSTEGQAIMLVETKERYERLIHKEYDRYNEWQLLLTTLDDNDKLIMIRYFQKKKSVRPDIINRLLQKIGKQIEAHAERIEQERTEQSEEDYKKYREQTRTFRIRKPAAVDDVRQRYLIGGEYFLWTPEEFAANQKQREDDERFKQWKINNNYGIAAH